MGNLLKSFYFGVSVYFTFTPLVKASIDRDKIERNYFLNYEEYIKDSYFKREDKRKLGRAGDRNLIDFSLDRERGVIENPFMIKRLKRILEVEKEEMDKWAEDVLTNFSNEEMRELEFILQENDSSLK